MPKRPDKAMLAVAIIAIGIAIDMALIAPQLDNGPLIFTLLFGGLGTWLWTEYWSARDAWERWQRERQAEREARSQEAD